MWADTPGTFDTRYGAQALAYLRRRTHENPWFAVVSGIMHAGQISYNAQQPVAERLLHHSPDVAFDIERTAKIIAGAQDAGRILPALTIGAYCYRKYCKSSTDCAPAPSGDLSQRGERLIECLRTTKRRIMPAEIKFLQSTVWKQLGPRGASTQTLWQKLNERVKLQREGEAYYMRGAGLGAKTRNLVAEYMGCDNAVAVDRHVGNWLANSVGRLAWVQRVQVTRRDKTTGRSRGTFWRQGVVTFTRSKAEARRLRDQGIAALDSGAAGQPKTFALMKREIHRMAKQCDIRPAELQVAAWAQGVCESVGQVKATSIALGEGDHVSCADIPRLHVPLSEWAAPVMDRPKAPAERFTCTPGYLGEAAPAAAIKITRKPPQPPPGEVWTYRYGSTQPVRILPQAAAAAAVTRRFLPAAALRPVYMGRRR
jgi:hypothetical protein